MMGNIENIIQRDTGSEQPGDPNKAKMNVQYNVNSNQESRRNNELIGELGGENEGMSIEGEDNGENNVSVSCSPSSGMFMVQKITSANSMSDIDSVVNCKNGNIMVVSENNKKDLLHDAESINKAKTANFSLGTIGDDV